MSGTDLQVERLLEMAMPRPNRKRLIVVRSDAEDPPEEEFFDASAQVWEPPEEEPYDGPMPECEAGGWA